jgi:hypothetical protein
MMDWLWINRQWVFSGVGVAVVAGVIGLFWRRRSTGFVQKERSGSHSTNIQAGRDIHIGGEGRHER